MKKSILASAAFVLACCSTSSAQSPVVEQPMVVPTLENRWIAAGGVTHTGRMFELGRQFAGRWSVMYSEINIRFNRIDRTDPEIPHDYVLQFSRARRQIQLVKDFPRESAPTTAWTVGLGASREKISSRHSLSNQVPVPGTVFPEDRKVDRGTDETNFDRTVAIASVGFRYTGIWRERYGFLGGVHYQQTLGGEDDYQLHVASTGKTYPRKISDEIDGNVFASFGVYF